MTTMENRNEPDRAAYAVALLGSPRRGGNTERLVDQAVAGALGRGVTIDLVRVADLKVSPCREIGACMTSGRCPIQDDMLPLYDRLTGARAVLLASPIFFYGPSAQLKAVIDRCQALWARKYLLKEPPGPGGRGYVISAAASGGRRLFDGFLLTARYFFDVLNLEPSGEVLIRGVDEKGAVSGRPDALAQARALGETLADHLTGRLPQGGDHA